MMRKIVSINKNKYPIVVVCIPYYSFMPEPGMALLQQLSTIGIPGYRVIILEKSSTIIHFARVEMVEDAEQYKYDFLFWLDADMGFPRHVMNAPTPNGIPIVISYMKQLLDHNLNIVGAPYVGRKAPHMPNVFYKSETDETFIPMLDMPESGIMEVGAVGTGFTCVKRNVFTTMKTFFKERVRKWNQAKDSVAFLKSKLTEDSPPEMKFHIQAIEQAMCNGHSGAYPPYWVDTLYDQGRDKYAPMGEDLYFCREATRAGFKIYCDFDIEIGHETTFFVTPSHYRQNYQNDVIEAHLRECARIEFPTPVKRMGPVEVIMGPNPEPINAIPAVGQAVEPVEK